jgi:DNA-binding HxlR family transcriptional regulator
MAYARKLNSSNTVNRTFLNNDCALTVAMDMLSARWTTQILYLISFNENRFSLLKKKLPGISDQVLGLRINHLMENKLIVKEEIAGEKFYSLTDKAEKLMKILNQLAEWQGCKKS